MSGINESWEAKAAAKRASILASIPQEWRLTKDEVEWAEQQRDLAKTAMPKFIDKLLDETEKAIVNLDSVPIVEGIKSKKFTAVQVAKAFCKTAAIAHQINPCLLEIFFDQALDRAKELDDYQEANGTTTGPLHGLPVSLKDQFNVKGVETCMAYVGWIGTQGGIDDPSKTFKIESQITKELLTCGAVLYCKTSLPQTVYIGETCNNIIGTTRNPHNKALTCGGSSGGEGALIALHGSTIGVGTDIGGSVRIPAAFCGIFSLKPTPSRISYKDAANTAPGQTTYSSTVGFLGTSIDGLDLIFKSILSTQPWLADPAVVPIPYRPTTLDSSKPLKIGVYRTDGVVNPHPPIRRGLGLFADAIKAAGHKVVEWNAPDPRQAYEVHESFMVCDGLYDIHQQLALSGEPLIPQLAESFKQFSPRELLDMHRLTLEGLAEEIKFNDYWNSTAHDDGQVVDAVIMPCAPSASLVPGKYRHLGYTRLINLLGYSAVVVPITKANKAIDVVDQDYEPLNEEDRLVWEDYDPELFDGAPVALQIVCRKFEEEKALAVAKELYSAFLKRMN